METTTSKKSIQVRVAAITHIGRVRTTNQDAHVVAKLGVPGAPVAEAELLDPCDQPLLLAIADGMGGAQAGEVASALAIDALLRELPASSPDWGTALRVAVEQANRDVWSAGQDPARAGMGTTLTSVVLDGVHAYVAEVGDSRAYLLRDGALRLLTHDQSYVQMLVDIGELKPAEAAASPLKNVLLSAIGHAESITAEMVQVDLEPGDTLLLCCDGLSNELSADELLRLLARPLSPTECCAALVTAANDKGGNDNITAIVARICARPEGRA